MNKLLLNIVKWLSPIWRNMGADPNHLQVILDAKLKMDSRRRSAFGAMGNRSKKQTKNQDLITMALFFFMGLAFMFFLILFEHTGSGLTIYFTAWMVFVTLTLITDFTDVLIDVRDNYILLPRPVNDRTITLSRLLHIGFYLSKLVLAFALPAMIAVPIKYGFFTLFLFLILLLISVVLSILFVNLIYLLILRLTSPTKFKEIITYIQIVFTSFIFIGYYLFPQFIDIQDYKNLNILEANFAWFLPSAWLGAVWELVYNMDVSLSIVLMSILAFLSPVISIYVVANFLAKDFNQKMLVIGQGGGNEEKTTTTEQVQKRTWRDRTAIWLTQSAEERAGYEWTWNITKRSRMFRIKLYPMFAFIPAYFIYLFFMGDGNSGEKYQRLLDSNNYIILLYFCFFLLSGSFNLTRFSEQYKAAWVYYAAPVPKPGPIIMGAFKACSVRFFMPFYLIVAVAVFLIWGIQTLDDILLGFINIFLLGLLLGYWTQRHLPFSEAWENQNKGSNITQGLMTMILASIIGALHYFLVSRYWWVGIAFMLTSGFLTWLVYRQYRNLTWRQLKT